MADAPDRRGFLKLATCAVGGGVGLVVAAPVIRLVLDPAGKTTVTTPTDPIDLGGIDAIAIGGDPQKVDIIAPLVKDAWTAARDVVLGAAWLRRTSPDQITALSAVCPHLGCAIGWDATAKNFVCPCHDSRFSPGGQALSGPSKRDMDPLPISVQDGRLRLVWKRFKPDSASREDA
jgi:Rieske Fe-S protein